MSLANRKPTQDITNIEHEVMSHDEGYKRSLLFGTTTGGDAVPLIVADSGFFIMDHGNLSGLGDDDHPQYVLTAGGRTITGDQIINGSFQAGDAVTDIHGINTAAVANRMITAAQTSVGTSYMYRNTLNNSGDGAKSVSGFYIDETVAGTNNVDLGTNYIDGLGFLVTDNTTYSSLSGGISSGVRGNVLFGGTNSGNNFINLFGGNFFAGGDIGTTGNTSHTGVYGAVSGTADNNYGGQFGATGGTNNYGVMINSGSLRLKTDNQKILLGTIEDVEIYYDNTKLIIDDTTTNAVDFVSSSITTTGDLNVTGINPDSDLTMFDGADVGDTTDGHKIRLYRRAAEGDVYVDMYVNQYKSFIFNSNGNCNFQSDGYVRFNPAGLMFFDVGGTGDYAVWRKDAGTGNVNIMKLDNNGVLKVGDTTTNYANISGNGDLSFVGSAGFYPRVLNQSAEPAAGTGSTQLDTSELCIWTDSDDSKGYLAYNQGGTVKTIEFDGGGSSYWTRTGTVLTTATAGDDVTLTGTVDLSGAETKYKYYTSAGSEPNIADDTWAVWYDSTGIQHWLIVDVGGTQFKAQLN